MQLQESGEMYLETILRLSQKGGTVRSIDVCADMGYSRPSVSRAVGLLKSAGYLLVEDDGALVLTPSGRAIAEKIYERHRIISAYLIELGVDPKTATDDACRIEHVISDESFAAIKRHISND